MGHGPLVLILSVWSVQQLVTHRNGRVKTAEGGCELPPLLLSSSRENACDSPTAQSFQSAGPVRLFVRGWTVPKGLSLGFGAESSATNSASSAAPGNRHLRVLQHDLLAISSRSAGRPDVECGALPGAEWCVFLGLGCWPLRQAVWLHRLLERLRQHFTNTRTEPFTPDLACRQNHLANPMSVAQEGSNM